MHYTRGAGVVVFGCLFVDKPSELFHAFRATRRSTATMTIVLCASLIAQLTAISNYRRLPVFNPCPSGYYGSLLTSHRPFTCRHAPMSPFATQCSCSDDETSTDKHNHFHPIHPPHLRSTLRAVSDFALFGKLVLRIPPCMSVRQAGDLRPASFRFHLTADTPALR